MFLNDSGDIMETKIYPFIIYICPQTSHGVVALFLYAMKTSRNSRKPCKYTFRCMTI